jgi:hypothetical protein
MEMRVRFPSPAQISYQTRFASFQTFKIRSVIAQKS